MSTWYRKDLGEAVAASEPSRVLREAFHIAFLKASDPKELAIFTRHDLRTNRVIAYFSPAAAPLAERFGATPCERPVLDEGLALLAGHSDSFTIHFPEG